MADKRLESISTMAHNILQRFVDLDAQGRDRLARDLLMPRPDDASLTFRADFAAHLQPRVEHLWTTQPMAPGPSREGQTELSLVATWSQDMASATDQPGHMVRLSRYMTDGYAWFSWRYHRPGAEEGTAFEGLAWTGDHWAWFPRALKVARMPLPSEE